MMGKKGISPLIATVLLIAFTMAIAGMMATWATSFVSTKMAETQNQTDITCSGNFNVDARVNGTAGFAVVDVASSNLNLTTWKGYAYYDDPVNNQIVTLSDSTMGMRTGDSWTFRFNVTVANPRYLKISASNCPVASKTVSITSFS